MRSNRHEGGRVVRMGADIGIKLKSSALAGLKSGWHCFAWMAEIIVPTSFLVALIQWLGWLDYLNVLLRPLVSFLSLPPEAGIAIISGMLVSIYSVIAVFSVVHFSLEQMTVIAVFALIAHNLIVEGIVQHRSGLNAIKATLVRIAFAVATAFVVSRLLGDMGQGLPLSIEAPIEQTSLILALRGWVGNTVALLVKILGLIMCIMVLLEVSKALGLIDRLLRVSSPMLRVLGLSQGVAVMYVTGIIFGLAYGGAVIVEEGKSRSLPRDELQYLHVSLGINHSMIEDPILFAMFGVNLLWMWIPRLIMAILAVQGYRLLAHVKGGRLR